MNDGAKDLELLGDKMNALYGIEGVSWVRRIPSMLEQLESDWRLTLGSPFSLLTYNYVISATNERGEEVILKLGFPGAELMREIQCLKLFQGRTSVLLLKSNPHIGALLMERAVPGRNLVEEDDEVAIDALYSVIGGLHVNPPGESDFPTVEDWRRGFIRYRKRFEGKSSLIPRGVVEHAETLYKNLTQSSEEQFLLHGDLHHGNILSAEREPWLAIDPQGVIGERAYELGAFLRNPMPLMLTWDDLEMRTGRRIELLAATFSIPEDRIAGWGYTQAILAAIWAIEESESWEPWVRIADVILQSGFVH